MRSAEDTNFKEGDFVWYENQSSSPERDADNTLFTLCRIIHKNDDDEVTLSKYDYNGCIFTSKVNNIHKANHLFTLDQNDMIKLKHINDPALLHHLHERFKNKKFYTKMGPLLIFINPNINLSPCNQETIRMHKFSETPSEGNPNEYTVALSALRNLSMLKRNQSIIVTGESGSGKSEITKNILNFLAYQVEGSLEERCEQKDVAGADESVEEGTASAQGDESEANQSDETNQRDEASQPNEAGESTQPKQPGESTQQKQPGESTQPNQLRLTEMIAHMNVLLDAFGSAKTGMNNNSSRLSKFFTLHMDEKGRVKSMHVKKFLFEKDRLIGRSGMGSEGGDEIGGEMGDEMDGEMGSQHERENSFNIFYYILNGSSDKFKEMYYLKDVKYYKMLRFRGSQRNGKMFRNGKTMRVNEDAVNEDAENEDAVNEDAVNEDAVNEDEVNENAVNDDAVNDDEVNEKNEKPPCTDESAKFHELLKSMNYIFDDDKEIDFVFSVLSALLLLGNVETVKTLRQKSIFRKGLLCESSLNFEQLQHFLEDANEDLITDENVKNFLLASKLLGINPEELVKYFTTNYVFNDILLMKVHNETKIHRKIEAFIKTTYDELFNWVLHKVNSKMEILIGGAAGGAAGSAAGAAVGQHNGNAESNYINVLDLAYFEKGEKNSLTELLVNTSNEAVRKMVVDFMFKKRIQLCREEGIETSSSCNIEQIDNEGLYNVLVQKGEESLFSYLESLSMKKATDKSNLHSLIVKKFAKGGYIKEGFSNVLDKKSRNSFPSSSFVIVHSCGEVCYSSEQLISQNIDILTNNFINMVKKSGNPYLEQLCCSYNYDPCGNIVEEKRRYSIQSALKLFRRKYESKNQMAVTMLRNSLDELMKVKENTFCHFIFCMTSNHNRNKVGGGEIINLFDEGVVLEQVQRMFLSQFRQLKGAGLFPHAFYFAELLDLLGGEAANGEAAGGEAANGEAAEGEAAQGEAALGESAQGAGLDCPHANAKQRVEDMMRLQSISKSEWAMGTNRIFLTDVSLKILMKSKWEQYRQRMLPKLDGALNDDEMEHHEGDEYSSDAAGLINLECVRMSQVYRKEGAQMVYQMAKQGMGSESQEGNGCFMDVMKIMHLEKITELYSPVEDKGKDDTGDSSMEREKNSYQNQDSDLNKASVEMCGIMSILNNVPTCNAKMCDVNEALKGCNPTEMFPKGSCTCGIGMPNFCSRHSQSGEIKSEGSEDESVVADVERGGEVEEGEMEREEVQQGEENLDGVEPEEIELEHAEEGQENGEPAEEELSNEEVEAPEDDLPEEELPPVNNATSSDEQENNIGSTVGNDEADAGESQEHELDVEGAGSVPGEVDAGEVDAGEVDAGEVDAGEVDADEVDAGEVDSNEAGEDDAEEEAQGVEVVNLKDEGEEDEEEEEEEIAMREEEVDAVAEEPNEEEVELEEAEVPKDEPNEVEVELAKEESMDADQVEAHEVEAHKVEAHEVEEQEEPDEVEEEIPQAEELEVQAVEVEVDEEAEEVAEEAVDDMNPFTDIDATNEVDAADEMNPFDEKDASAEIDAGVAVNAPHQQDENSTKDETKNPKDGDEDEEYIEYNLNCFKAMASKKVGELNKMLLSCAGDEVNMIQNMLDCYVCTEEGQEYEHCFIEPNFGNPLDAWKNGFTEYPPELLNPKQKHLLLNHLNEKYITNSDEKMHLMDILKNMVTSIEYVHNKKWNIFFTSSDYYFKSYVSNEDQLCLQNNFIDLNNKVLFNEECNYHKNKKDEVHKHRYSPIVEYLTLPTGKDIHEICLSNNADKKYIKNNYRILCFRSRKGSKLDFMNAKSFYTSIKYKRVKTKNITHVHTDFSYMDDKMKCNFKQHVINEFINNPTISMEELGTSLLNLATYFYYENRGSWCVFVSKKRAFTGVINIVRNRYIRMTAKNKTKKYHIVLFETPV